MRLVDRTTLEQPQRTLECGQGFVGPASRAEQRPEVVQVSSDRRRIGAELRLLDRNDSTVEPFGLLESTASLHDRGEIVEGDGDLRMVRAEGSLEVGQQSADDRRGLVRPPETVKDG